MSSLHVCVCWCVHSTQRRRGWPALPAIKSTQILSLFFSCSSDPTYLLAQQRLLTNFIEISNYTLVMWPKAVRASTQLVRVHISLYVETVGTLALPSMSSTVTAISHTTYNFTQRFISLSIDMRPLTQYTLFFLCYSTEEIVVQNVLVVQWRSVKNNTAKTTPIATSSLHKETCTGTLYELRAATD